jgi:hypothetical protein
MRLGALYDCIKVPKLDSDLDTVTHHVYVRAQAAFSLARLQNSYPPFKSGAEEGGSWKPMRRLLKAFRELYNEGNTSKPKDVNIEDMPGTYLRRVTPIIVLMLSAFNWFMFGTCTFSFLILFSYI